MIVGLYSTVTNKENSARYNWDLLFYICRSLNLTRPKHNNHRTKCFKNQFKWYDMFTLKKRDRVWQLAYVAYVRTPTLISVHMIWIYLGWHVRSLFPYGFLKFSKFSCSYNFMLLKNLQLHIWLLIYLFVLWRDRFSTVTFVLKKPYFSVFNTNYLINISPYLGAPANFLIKLWKSSIYAQL